MVDDNTTQQNDELDGIAPSTRRKLLATLGVGGASALAGCGGDGGGDDTTTTTTQQGTAPGGADLGTEDTETATETETETMGEQTQTPTETETGVAQVSGQSLTFRTTINPEEVSFLDWAPENSEYVPAWEMDAARLMQMATGRWQSTVYRNAIGETHYGTAENINFHDDGSITVTLADDAKWSDGNDVRALDVAGMVAVNRVENLKEPFERPDTSFPWRAPSNVRMPDGPDGKVVEIDDELDALKPFTKTIILDRCFRGFWRHIGPSHKEPLTEIFNAAVENLEAAREGGDWGNEADIKKGVMGAEDWSSTAEQWRDPDHVESTGAFQLSEIRGAQEVVLEPNPHHRNADQINFEEVIFTNIQEQQRLRSSLNADQLDYAEELLPNSVAEGLPDHIERINLPTNNGNSLGFDHADTHFQHRKVRQAIQYALNTETIAKNVHPTATRAIGVPGGDLFEINTVASDSWIDNTLENYGTSAKMDEAEAAMEEAGYTRDGDEWVGPDGGSISPYQLPTTEETPTFETSVADQLSDFGIPMQVQSYDTSTYGEKWDAGDFQIWPESWMTGFFHRASMFWRIVPDWHERLPVWNLWDDETQQAALDKYKAGGEWASTEGLKELEIQIPPVGEPDGELQTFKAPVKTEGNGTLVIADTEEMHKKYFWTANWHLPVVPVHQQFSHQWVDTTHWNWPRDHYMWDYLGIAMWPWDMTAFGWIQADPDNPEEGASVE